MDLISQVMITKKREEARAAREMVIAKRERLNLKEQKQGKSNLRKKDLI